VVRIEGKDELSRGVKAKTLKPFAVYFELPTNTDASVLINVYALNKRAAKKRAKLAFRCLFAEEAPTAKNFYNPMIVSEAPNPGLELN
jgi:hypothetical protein